MFKKITAVCVCLGLVVSITGTGGTPVQAASPVGMTSVMVNGVMLTLESQAYVKQGRVMAPLRDMAKGLGAQLYWDAPSRTATLKRASHQAEIKAGSSRALRDGGAVILDVPAEIRSGRVYVPLRFVVESVDATISWNVKTGTAQIILPLDPASAKSVIAERAAAAVQALKTKDWAALSSMVHSTRGVRFSPYGYVDTAKDIVRSRSEIAAAGADGTVRTWGAYDGTGDPIKLTFAQYYDKFIYSADFADAPEMGYNQTIGTGNSLNNARNVYPDAILVEYHYDGFDPQYDGMDWQSLRLVFVKEGGQWMLVGIIHDQWTI
ncbi:stalk domain-containing protein [Paenibacillus zanthoxyli]|uniref:stalk domain-containing protein n=1 Tax=Paenibacillus zanthoxyli TaxID=369399 RepID=UPI00046EBC2D|nr:stalk domain-containing protein [Paenibacillus zanthoxyli]